MSAYEVVAAVMLLGLVPLAVVAVRGSVVEAVVAFEAAATITGLVLALLAQGFDRSGETEFPLVAAVLALAGALVFTRYLAGGGRQR